MAQAVTMTPPSDQTRERLPFSWWSGRLLSDPTAIRPPEATAAIAQATRQPHLTYERSRLTPLLPLVGSAGAGLVMSAGRAPSACTTEWIELMGGDSLPPGNPIGRSTPAAGKDELPRP